MNSPSTSVLSYPTNSNEGPHTISVPADEAFYDCEESFSVVELPTYQQYKGLETNYLNTKCPDRALIARDTYLDIVRVHINEEPLDLPPSFSDWARSLFRLDTLPSHCLAPDIPSGEAVFHCDRPVAVRELIYDIICRLHRQCGHADHDITYESISQQYSYIPKQLVADFIKICPTCERKKRLSVEKDSDVESIVRSQEDSYLVELDHLLQSDQQFEASSNNKMSIESDLRHLDHLPAFPSESELSLDSLSSLDFSLPPAFTRVSSTISNISEVDSLPMSREVSLFKGLPNGWQYRTDYNTALDDFIKTKQDLKTGYSSGPPTASDKDNNVLRRANRPRVPSIAPLRTIMLPNVVDVTKRDGDANDGSISSLLVDSGCASTPGLVSSDVISRSATSNLHVQPLNLKTRAISSPGALDADSQ